MQKWFKSAVLAFEVTHKSKMLMYCSCDSIDRIGVSYDIYIYVYIYIYIALQRLHHLTNTRTSDQSPVQINFIQLSQ